MQKSKFSAPERLWMAIGLLTTGLSLQLLAYQQGSYFLYDIREDAPESGSGERIAVAASIFKAEEAKPETPMAEQGSKSEFETSITSFGGKGSTPASSASGVKILEVETDDPDTESSFGEDPPAPSGFFFTY